MTCPYLEYRSEHEHHEFDHTRPFCRVQEEFVSPMKADICNDRFDFAHDRECEIYRESENRTTDVEDDATVDAVDGSLPFSG